MSTTTTNALPAGPLRRALGAQLLACVLATLVACGGGVGSGGTGLPDGATGVSVMGTVNGFGSIFVDGVRYDDSQAATTRESDPGVFTPTAAVLGDSLEVDTTTAGVVTQVRVEPTVIGPVARLVAGGGFVVLGQTVMLNGDATRGPVTQFTGGYTGAAAVAAGDAVEVHAVLVRQTSGFTLQATRVGRLPALPAYVKATGIAALAGSNALTFGTLRVDAVTARVLPAASTLADGQLLAVWADRNSLSFDAGGTPRLVAAQVRIKRVGPAGAEASVSGVVANLNTSAARFDLGGIMVQYGAGTVLPAGKVLAAGAYVRVAGRVLADRSVQATTVTVRDGVGQPEAELKGNVSGFIAATQRFTLRGAVVDASSAWLENCPATGLADGLYVEVEGRLSATAVVARNVHCAGEPAGATVERNGVAGNVDATAQRFDLTLASGAVVPVGWTANTYFNGGTPATLAGKRVELHGTVVNGVLIAQELDIEH